jgi:hypothetical protein
VIGLSSASRRDCAEKRWALRIASGFTIAFVLALTQIAADDNRALLAERVVALTRDSHWTLVDSVRVSFKTFHPQGLVKIGDTFFVSSVEGGRRDLSSRRN